MCLNAQNGGLHAPLKNNGFSILEVIIVLSLLLLTTSLTISYLDITRPTQAKYESMLATHFSSLEAAIKNYADSKGTYPDDNTTNGLIVNSTNFPDLVPGFIMPAAPPEGVTGYYYNRENTGSGSLRDMYLYVFANTDASTAYYKAFKSLAAQYPEKVFCNTSHGVQSNMSSDPSSTTTVYLTWWIKRP